jgi:hypothetical protein
MKIRKRIAFIIYFINSLVTIIFGIAYLFCSTIMPYHQEAIKMNWGELSPSLQVLLQALIKMSAAGNFVTGLSILLLLFIPFRQGAQWAHWAIPLLAIIWNGFGLYVMATVATKTSASTPWPFTVLGIIAIIIAFILSPGFGKNHQEKPENTRGKRL